MDTITVGGLPGTGTTTLCRLLHEQTGLPYTYAGRIFRDEATRRGMDLAEFGELCEQDASVDRALDAKQVELLHGGHLILEGRLSAWLAARERLPALKVWVHCDDAERVRRLVDRDGGTADEQLARTRRREASEHDRYGHYYGIDLDDLSVYDLVLDSTHTDPDGLARQVIAAFEQAGGRIPA